MNRSFLDHGEGLIALRVFDPLSVDSGIYTCMIASEYGCCVTSAEITIEDLEEELSIVAPEFIKSPYPTVAMCGSSTAYCARVSPVTSKTKWFVCGREITENSRGYTVSALQQIFFLESHAFQYILSTAFELTAKYCRNEINNNRN